MHQQVNLYQPVFRRQQKVFSAVTLSQILGAVLLLLLTLLGHAHWSLAELKTTRASLQEQFDQVQQALVALGSASAGADTRVLDAEIAQLQDTLDNRRLLLQQFDRIALDNTGGFAAGFEALAHRDMAGLWLTGVSFDEHGAIELRGVALDPRLIPRYLQLLARQPELSGQRFDSVIIRRPVETEPAVEFLLQNQQAREVR